VEWCAATPPCATFSATISPERSSTISTDEACAAAYDYELPQELIAQSPAPQRDESRLMVLDGAQTSHRRFSELLELLAPGDLLAINETRVIRARLRGKRVRGTGDIELLLLHPAGALRYDSQALRWIALARPARRLREGDRISFGEFGEAAVTAVLPEGMREIALELPDTFEAFLDRAGRMPLPPYIRNDSAQAQERYQSVFARVPGSVAAPTASLHFTPELLAALEGRGVEIVRLALDVGLGTFRPMVAARIDEHVMHAESYVVDTEAAAALERARRERRRIVAVGTTVVRALEGSYAEYGRIEAGVHRTDLFVRPGFTFNVIGAMITNFHLPRSTLLVLVSAFAGRERILSAYREAIALGYRFYSFGDAMLLLR
jgi:S-adenosylmethionine:tRNA ribosyltransferase-isomerase